MKKAFISLARRSPSLFSYLPPGVYEQNLVNIIECAFIRCPIRPLKFGKMDQECQGLFSEKGQNVHSLYDFIVIKKLSK